MKVIIARPGSAGSIRLRKDVKMVLGSQIYFAGTVYRVVSVGYDGLKTIPVIYLSRGR